MPARHLDIRTCPAADIVRFWTPLARRSRLKGLLLLPFDRIASRLADPFSRALVPAMLSADAPSDLADAIEAERAAQTAGFARRLDLSLLAADAIVGGTSADTFAAAAGPLAGTTAGAILQRSAGVRTPVIGLDQPVPDFAADLAWCVAAAASGGLLAIEEAADRCGFPHFAHAVMLAVIGIEGAEHGKVVRRRAQALTEALTLKTRMVAEYAHGIRFGVSAHGLHHRVVSLLPEDVTDDGIPLWMAEWEQDGGEDDHG